MKKAYLALIVLLFMLSSCAGIHWRIGQTSDDFFAMNKSHRNQFEVVKMSNELTVYKWVNGWSYDAPWFFYFQYGTLTQVDRGVRPPDVIIQNR